MVSYSGQFKTGFMGLSSGFGGKAKTPLLNLDFEITDQWNETTGEWERLHATFRRTVAFSLVDGKAFEISLQKLDMIGWNRSLESPAFTPVILDDGTELDINKSCDIINEDGTKFWKITVCESGSKPKEHASPDIIKAMQARVDAARKSKPVANKTVDNKSVAKPGEIPF